VCRTTSHIILLVSLYCQNLKTLSLVDLERSSKIHVLVFHIHVYVFVCFYDFVSVIILIGLK